MSANRKERHERGRRREYRLERSSMPYDGISVSGFQHTRNYSM